MKLTATPFDPQTGDLLPVYRDAYLRGDLSGASARSVEMYLRGDASEAHSTVTRWHEMSTEDRTAPAAPGWVQTQMRFIREQPQRFRRRALTMVSAAALVAGVSMAGTRLPDHNNLVNLPVATPVLASLETATAAAAEARTTRMVTLSGRILNEAGKPLVGATVMRKGTHFGVSTDADGNYALRVPAAESTTATLQYGYAGYEDREMQAAATASGKGVTLQPRTPKRRHWLFF